MSNNHKIGAALVLVAVVGCAGQAWAVSGGTAYVQANLGAQATAATAAVANVTLVATAPIAGDVSIIELDSTPVNNVPGAPPQYNDTHTVKNITMNTGDPGTAKVVLSYGDPRRLGGAYANGSVNLQVYTAGTAAGANPNSMTLNPDGVVNRTALENIGRLMKEPPYTTAKVGIFINTVTAPAINGLGMRVTQDQFGAKYLDLREMLLGDIVTSGLGGDGKVNGFDLNQLLAFLGKAWGYSTGGITYNYYTWLEGDITAAGLGGAGKVNGFDLNAMLANLGGAAFNPNNGGLEPVGGPAGVPEPGTWAMILSGIFGILLLRRLTGLRRRVE